MGCPLEGVLVSVGYQNDVAKMFHLRQKSIISSGPANTCASTVGAPHTDSQCLPLSELLIISTLATAKPRAEPEAESNSKHFDTNRAFHIAAT
jgi:hypothetical protein